MDSLLALYPDLSDKEKAAAQMLADCGQSHVWDAWRAGQRERVRRCLSHVAALDAALPTGVNGYLKDFEKLILDAKTGVSLYDGFSVAVPSGFTLSPVFGNPAFDAAEAAGVAVFRRCAFVLVAGGLGERLGFGGIKLALPSETATNTPYLQLFASQIVELERRSLGADYVPGQPSGVPLVIMTSDDTDAPTRAFIDAHPDLAAMNITLLKQDKVPAVADVDGHLAMDPADPYKLCTKPHGHGDVHGLLHRSGVAQQWADDGREFVMFLQDTNPHTFTVGTAALGVSAANNLQINSVCLPRKAGEAVGVIADLTAPDGSTLTGNVEYNQLDGLLRSSGSPDGDVNDASTGYSPFPGNTNVLVYSIPPYARTLATTRGAVPEFCNPKWLDKDKTVFAAPCRLESMMQDYSRSVDPEEPARVAFTQFDDWIYMPTKNSIAQARKKQDAGLPLHCAAASEAQVYRAWVWCLEAIGVRVEAEATRDVAGLTVPAPATVVLHPSFAPTFAVARSRFPSPHAVSISRASTLVVSGRDVTIQHLALDGALEIDAVDGAVVTIKALTVVNAGWEFVSVVEGSAEWFALPEELRVRGHRVQKKDTMRLSFPVPGTYVVDDGSSSV